MPDDGADNLAAVELHTVEGDVGDAVADASNRKEPGTAELRSDRQGRALGLALGVTRALGLRVFAKSGRDGLHFFAPQNSKIGYR